MNDTAGLAEALNRDCQCSVADIPLLQSDLDARLASDTPLRDSHPHLFCDTPVFIAQPHVDAMNRAIQAIEAVTRLPAWRESALSRAPATARVESPARGVLFGYDFHVDADGPRLIEVNTNAGGVLLNVELRRALGGCCPPAADPEAGGGAAAIENSLVEMFHAEWRLAGQSRPLRSIAIVDDDPRAQFLYPELALFERLFQAHGIRAFIADARELEHDGRTLSHRGEAIDVVYNRLTDFYLESPAHAALARAWREGTALLTPHPRAHALQASKRNLVTLSNPELLRQFGARESDIDALKDVIPRTEYVDGDADRWWRDRKRWFFKPVDGFGSRGAYRGDKLTRRVFDDILRGGYVAQLCAPAGQRLRSRPDGMQHFKIDLRQYAYAGSPLLLAARVYQGQTTNFRSPGGGFAPVHVVRKT